MLQRPSKRVLQTRDATALTRRRSRSGRRRTSIEDRNCELWTEQRERFRLNALHHTAGLDIWCLPVPGSDTDHRWPQAGQYKTTVPGMMFSMMTTGRPHFRHTKPVLGMSVTRGCCRRSLVIQTWRQKCNASGDDHLQTIESSARRRNRSLRSLRTSE